MLASIAILVLTGFFGFRDASIGTSDFAYIWLGPRTFLDGGNPYDAASWAEALRSHGTPLGTLEVYSYPPYVLAALLPLGALPLSLSYGAWTWIGLAAALLGLSLLLSAFAPKDRVLHALVPPAALLSEPSLENLYGGQWALFVLAAFAMLAVAHRSPKLAALATVALAPKPHLTGVAVLGVAYRALRRGERRVAAAMAGSVIVLAAGTLLLAQGMVASWMRALPRVRAEEVTSSSLWNAVGPVAAGLILLIATAVVARGDVSGPASLAPYFALSILAALYAHPYDHLPLLVPIIIAANAHHVLARVGVVAFVALGWALFLSIPSQGDFERWSATVPLVTFAIVAFVALRFGTRARRASAEGWASAS